MKTFANIPDSDKAKVQERMNFTLKQIIEHGIEDKDFCVIVIYNSTLTDIIDFEDYKTNFDFFFNMYLENHPNTFN